MAAFMLSRSIRHLKNSLRSQCKPNIAPNLFELVQQDIYLEQRCTYKLKQPVSTARQKVKLYKELYNRRMEAGPEPVRHPSAYGCWNHESEVYAFGQRLGEDIDELALKRAFLQPAYVEQGREKQKDLGIDMVVDTQDNEELAVAGTLLASRYVKAYLRRIYPHMFEEGIMAIHDYLLSDDTLYFISSNLGLKELIMSAEYPPDRLSYIKSFLAVIGAICESQGTKRAEIFVQDFIVPQLVGRDINEIWPLMNPMGLLVAVLKAQGRDPPEPRLLFSSASKTLMPLYHVGIYCNKELIGKSPGETQIIAEEMAARDALKHVTQAQDWRTPLLMGDKAYSLELDYDTPNRSVKDVS